jgi:G3E family GTPase
MNVNLPFTVIGGYLGAGKTTLLNHLLSNADGLRLAVLVNDFGSVNIDAGLIRSHHGDTISLDNGCMCCSLVNGFASAIGQIRDRSHDFDHVVIEASGVADPGTIARYGQMYELPLDGVLVVVDAEQIRRQSTDKYVGDTVLYQLSQADLLVLNKIDLVSEETRSSLRTWLSEHSPGTPIIETVKSELPLDVLFSARTDREPTGVLSRKPHFAEHARCYETWTVERTGSVSRPAMERFATSLGSDIYRAKGFVCLEHDPQRRYVFQQVGHRWTLEPGDPINQADRRTLIVVIGRKGATDSSSLERLLESEDEAINECRLHP